MSVYRRHGQRTPDEREDALQRDYSRAPFTLNSVRQRRSLTFLVGTDFGEPMVIKLKRAYEVPESRDGFRVLVDRLWPRGVSKSSARLDLWLKEIAPSATLRKWFGHDPSKWTQFRDRYFEELDKNPKAVEQIRKQVRRGMVTLVYGAKDRERNDAVALKEYLESKRSH